MNFTYKQPYVTWKGISTGSAVPTWSRPLINNVNTNKNTGTSFAARPIKHWRKQLVPAADTGISRSSGIGMPMDRPGGSVYLGATVDCSNCRVNLAELIPTTKNTVFNTTKDASGNCVACNPETNIIKSAVTLLNKNYYTDTKAYLQSRSQTYDQKLSINPSPGINYSAQPSDSPTGSQVYFTDNCSDKKCTNGNSRVTTIYKPNNQQYSQQGAVSSSSRLDRLKYNTITKNANSFKTAWGKQGANAGSYKGTTEAPYFLKSKNQEECVPFHRDGNKTTSCVVPLPPPVPAPICGDVIDISTIANNIVGNNWLIVANKTIEICQILNINNGISLGINAGVTLTVKGTININAGGIVGNFLGGKINIESFIFMGVIAGGTININAGGRLNNDGNITNTLNGDIFNAGTLDNVITGIITNDGRIDNQPGGIIENKGKIVNNAGGIFINSNVINNNINGIITNNATFSNTGGTINNRSGSVFNNNLGGTIFNFQTGLIDNQGSGKFNNNDGDIDNRGTISNRNTAEFNNDLGGTITNKFGAQINNTSTFFNKNNSIITNNGGQINNGLGGTITNKTGGQIINEFFGQINNSTGIINNDLGGTINNNNGGTINNTVGGTINNAGGTIENDGTIDNKSNIGIINTGGIINNNNGGTINNNDGGIIDNPGGTITNNNGGIINNITGGVIFNISIFGGTITNNGVLNSPDPDIGCGVGIINGPIAGTPPTNACP